MTSGNKLPRGRCSVCGRTISIKNGKLVRHRFPTDQDQPLRFCEGRTPKVEKEAIKHVLSVVMNDALELRYATRAMDLAYLACTSPASDNAFAQLEKFAMMHLAEQLFTEAANELGVKRCQAVNLRMHNLLIAIGEEEPFHGAEKA